MCSALGALRVSLLWRGLLSPAFPLSELPLPCGQRVMEETKHGCTPGNPELTQEPFQLLTEGLQWHGDGVWTRWPAELDGM